MTEHVGINICKVFLNPGAKGAWGEIKVICRFGIVLHTADRVGLDFVCLMMTVRQLYISISPLCRIGKIDVVTSGKCVQDSLPVL